MNSKTLIFAGAGFLVALLVVFSFWMTSESTPPPTPSVQKIERARDGVCLVVKIRTLANGRVEVSGDHWLGSAFVISDKGYLITSAHLAGATDRNNRVAEPNTQDVLYVVSESRQRGRRVVVLQRATVEYMDIARDLACLRVIPERSGLRPLALAESAAAGQNIVALGFSTTGDVANRYSRMVRDAVLNQMQRMNDRIELEWNSAWGELLSVATVGGSVAEIRRSSYRQPGSQGVAATYRIMTHTAPIRGRMGGGPVLNTLGQVVGVSYGGSNNYVTTDDGKLLVDDNGRPVRSNTTLLNSALDVAELRHFLTTQIPSGEELVLSGDPDSFMRRLQAHLGAAQPHEIALAALGGVFTVGALITLVFLLRGRRGDPRDDYNSSAVPIDLPQSESRDYDPTLPMGDAVENEGKTIPFPAAMDSVSNELSVVLSGDDPNGAPLRFRFTESALREKRAILIGSRQRSCDIHLPFNYISRQQARLIYEQDASGNGLLFLQDENATNTTCINGTPVRTKCPLEPGDVITMGPISLTLSIE